MARHIPDEILYDLRLQSRHLQRGLLTADALARYIEQIPDRSEHAAHIDLDRLTAAVDRSHRS